MATRGTVCERQGQAQRTSSRAHRRRQASVTYATRYLQRLTPTAPPRRRRPPAHQRREAPFAREEREQRALPPPQTRRLEGRAPSRLSEGPQPRKSPSLGSSPPPPPPQARHDAILEAPSQPLPISQRQPQADQATHEPFGTLEVAHPPRRLNPPLRPQGILAPSTSNFTRSVSINVVSSTLAVGRLPLPAGVTPGS